MSITLVLIKQYYCQIIGFRVKFVTHVDVVDVKSITYVKSVFGSCKWCVNGV